MTDKLFIVMGATGEYSDRTEWNVAAHFDEALARKHVDLLTEWMAQNVTEDDCPTCPFDPSFCSDYTGTNYWVDDVPIWNEANLILAKMGKTNDRSE